MLWAPAAHAGLRKRAAQSGEWVPSEGLAMPGRAEAAVELELSHGRHVGKCFLQHVAVIVPR